MRGTKTRLMAVENRLVDVTEAPAEVTRSVTVLDPPGPDDLARLAEARIPPAPGTRVVLVIAKVPREALGEA